MRKILTLIMGLVLISTSKAQTSPIDISNNWYFDVPDAPDVQISMQGSDIPKPNRISGIALAINNAV